jgi:hypothetical protein
MRYTGLWSDYHEFRCDTCGRHVLIHSDPLSARDDEQTLVILKQGDLWASHSGGFGGLVINGIEVEKDQAELTEEWKTWLTEILDDVE